MRAPVLPDVLQPDLDVVFCGTAPGHVSAAAKAYYAHPQNKFWRILHETGLTPQRIVPADYATLLSHRIGLTDLAKFDKGMDRDLQPGALGPLSVSALHERILTHQPRFLAFTSKTGGGRFLKGPRSYGLQPETLGQTKIWILPSTSPAAMNFWDDAHWHALATEIRGLQPVVDLKKLSR